MSALPAFKEACLASDITSKSVSLVGSVNGGELEVYSISLGDPSAATSTFKVKDVTPLIAWSPSLPKYCFASPSDMSTIFSSVDVTVVQFGETEAFMGSFGTGDRASVPVSVPALAGGSPKLFALTAATSKKEIFNAYVKGDPGPGKAWRGLLVDLEQPIASKQIRNAGNATTKSSALLAVGILQNSYSAEKGSGYSVIIDGGGTSGTTFSANGDTSISATSDSPFLTFGSSVPVLMNGNVLSDKAVPVSMTGTSYILDQDTSTRTVVIYSIKSLDTYGLGGSHEFAANLTKIIPSSGYTPLYSGSLVATYLGKTIVTYTLGSDNKPTMSSFDIATSKWTEVKITTGSSSSGGGGLSTALTVVVFVATFLVLCCLIRCFWGTIKGLFYCITGKPTNDEVYVVQVVPDQDIALEKINDYPQQPQPIVYIDNSVNTTIDNNSSNNNNVNTNNSVNNSVNNNSVNTNNSVNHNNSVNTNNSVNNNSVNTNNSVNHNNSVNNNSVNNNSVNNHSVNNSGNVMGIQPASGAATPSTVFGTPAPQYPSSPYSQPPYSPSPQYHADPYSYSAPSSHFQSAGSPPAPMATTPQQFYSAPPQHYATSPPPQVYGTSDGSQQQQQQPNW
ncbi:hypothetical protein BGX30_008010 [Mortierella sp. GBA39]|nr:hypothetical protein BGX30_008010 [Mortierella sp. GBA39]